MTFNRSSGHSSWWRGELSLIAQGRSTLRINLLISDDALQSSIAIARPSVVTGGSAVILMLPFGAIICAT